MIPAKVEMPPIEARENPDALKEAMNKLINRTEAEMLASRARVMKTVRMGRPLPEGKTLADVVEGQWPGDETDEQIFEALERLS